MGGPGYLGGGGGLKPPNPPSVHHWLQLMSRLRLDGALSLLSLYAFMACTGTIVSQKKSCLLLLIFSVFYISVHLSIVRLFLFRGVQDFGEDIKHSGSSRWGGCVGVFGELREKGRKLTGMRYIGYTQLFRQWLLFSCQTKINILKSIVFVKLISVSGQGYTGLNTVGCI